MMTDQAEVPTSIRPKRTLARWKLEWQRISSPILRYGFSVVSVAFGLGVALTLQHYGFREVESPLFSLVIVLTAWYSGIGPSVVAVLLSVTCFNFFFTEPLYSLEITRQDLPNFFLFVAWAIIIAGFVTVRRRIEEDLRQTRDNLQVEVEQRRHREDEIRKLNQELAQRAAELEATNKELESFAYSVSHDLRAPLRHMVGYSELLQKQASSLLDDKSQRFIRTILDSAKRMGNLIDDLLAFSRIGRAETKKTEVDLEQLVEEVVAEIGQDTKSRDIAWKIGALPVCYGDRSMLRLVVVNLVSNAVKFTRMRRPAEIEIGCVDGNKNEIEVFVRDNGAGFDMQYVNKLYVNKLFTLQARHAGAGIGRPERNRSRDERVAGRYGESERRFNPHRPRSGASADDSRSRPAPAGLDEPHAQRHRGDARQGW